MYDKTRAALGSAGTEKSELFKQLRPEEQADVTAFLQWLAATGDVQAGSVPSYKSYVCNGILKDDDRKSGELTKSEKSGMKKFIYWLDNVKDG